MKTKKVIALFMVCLLLLSFGSFGVYAEDTTDQPEQIEPRYSDFAAVYGDLYRTDNGLYSISGGAGAANGQKLITVTVTLERLNLDTGKWVPVNNCTWTSSGYASVMAGGTRSLAHGVYQAHTVASIYLNGTLLETVEAVSKMVSV